MKAHIKQNTTTIPADLQELKQQFEHWRKTRTSLGRTPPELMRTAVTLSRVHGAIVVVKYLGLNYASLKAFARKTEKAPATPAKLRPSASTIQKCFVELARTPLEESQQEPSLVQVHCEQRGLSVVLKSPQIADWQNLLTGYFLAHRSLGAGVIR